MSNLLLVLQAELHLGIGNRAVAATRMNASSSRSHASFTIHVQQRRLLPSSTPSPQQSEDGGLPASPQRPARESDQVEELVEAHMVFVDLAGDVSIWVCVLLALSGAEAEVLQSQCCEEEVVLLAILCSTARQKSFLCLMPGAAVHGLCIVAMQETAL